jgi:hypothetical protein
MTRRSALERATQELDAQLVELYRAIVREPVPAWLLATADQLDAVAELGERAA